jgi:hypothetical protein
VVCSSCEIFEKIEQKLNRDEYPKVSEDNELKNISKAQMDSLKNKVILFAHQSVGQNIVEGLENIGSQHDLLKLNIRLITRPEEISGPGFYHFIVGKNHEPLSKIRHFEEFVRNAPALDIAFLKFCYIDIKDTTDVQNLFGMYDSLYATLNADFKETKFICFSCPYRSEEDKANANRNRYNEIFRNKYNGNENIFDLALLESTAKDGKRAQYVLDGKTNYRMNRPYTKDSGHLNAYGSFLVAKNLLLKMLSL